MTRLAELVVMALDAPFNEDDHPRAGDGKFGSGGGAKQDSGKKENAPKYASNSDGKTRYEAHTSTTNITKITQARKDAHSHAEHLKKLGHTGVKVFKKFSNITIPGKGASVVGTYTVDHGKAPQEKVEATIIEALQLYRGEYSGNKGGKFYTPDREWARQFTQSGQEKEIKEITVNSGAVYDPETPVYAGDPDAIEAAIKEAKDAGFFAVRLDEGPDQPKSVYVFDLAKAIVFTMAKEKKH